MGGSVGLISIAQGAAWNGLLCDPRCLILLFRFVTGGPVMCVSSFLCSFMTFLFGSLGVFVSFSCFAIRDPQIHASMFLSDIKSDALYKMTYLTSLYIECKIDIPAQLLR